MSFELFNVRKLKVSEIIKNESEAIKYHLLKGPKTLKEIGESIQINQFRWLGG